MMTLLSSSDDDVVVEKQVIGVDLEIPKTSIKPRIKKPVPLPRSKIDKKSIEIESSKLSLENSGSPLPEDDTDRKTERRRRKKKDSKGDKEEEVELKTFSEKKEIPSRHKSPVHASSKEVVEETGQELRFNYDRIVGISIHRSDCLRVDPLVRHPLVKVHLLDAETGEYLKKSDAQRSVSFYNEKSVDYILPLMTDVFDFKQRRSLVPVWEELLVFNEDFEYILRNEPAVIILFEILDLMNFTVASSQYRRLGSEGGWHHIAWAFLKPLGANGVKNVEKTVRLQLYKPQHVYKSYCNVYHWWRRGIWEQYPGTLYVTVKGITPPEQMPAVLRSRSALQGEINQPSPFLDVDHTEAKSEDNENSTTLPLLSTGKSQPAWTRMPSQSCKIPNQRCFVLPTASKGCFYVKFSNSGLHLACSVAAEDKFTIIVYSIPDGQELVQFVGHQALIYDLHWSAKDTMLLSASADCTACIWDVDALRSTAMQMLPHPSFVYCAQFHSGNSSVLMTGCYDHVVRIWNRRNKSAHYELLQELEGHAGFVTAVTSNAGGVMYSGDSVGLIIEWLGAKPKSLWKLNRKLDVRELRDSVVNKLCIHPGGQRLLVHVRDSRLRMLDLSTASVIQWFNGALNHRVQIAACLSPCGGLVLAASEDSTIRVWNADTGEQMAIYSGLQFVKGASGVDYHPHEHMVAFSSYGGPAQVVVCDYSKSPSGKELGLQLLHKDSSTEKHRDLQVIRGSPNSTVISSPWKDNGSKIKLANIIEKMDQVLSKTPSRSSQQISDSHQLSASTPKV